MSKKFLRNNGLSIVVLTIFLFLLAGQAISGFFAHNADQRLHEEKALSFFEYLKGPHFLEATFENWESEFLQMAAYVVLTAFLFQKGSAESKDPEKREPEPVPGKNSPAVVRRGGWRLRIYEHSLSLVLFGLFLVSWIGHAMSGAKEFNDQLRDHGQPEVSVTEFILGSKFWFESLQNWQSGFLAVGAIVILSIWLRESGSPESKPVAAPHDQTGA